MSSGCPGGCPGCVLGMPWGCPGVVLAGALGVPLGVPWGRPGVPWWAPWGCPGGVASSSLNWCCPASARQPQGNPRPRDDHRTLSGHPQDTPRTPKGFLGCLGGVLVGWGALGVPWGCPGGIPWGCPGAGHPRTPPRHPQDAHRTTLKTTPGRPQLPLILR